MSTRVLGLGALLLTMLSWVAFALSVRALPGAGFSVLDSSTIRYATPALLLLPWWPRAWREVRRTDPRVTILLILGGGASFYLLMATGAQTSSAIHISIFNLGLVPLMVVLIGFVLRWKQRITLLSGSGLVAVVAGMVMITLAIPGTEGGVALLVASSLLWAIFTLAQGKAGFHPLSTAVIIAVPSALLGFAIDTPHLVEGALAHPGPFLLLVLIQGVGTGVLSTGCYAAAINALGARLTALIAAFTPALVAVAAAIVLHEVFPPLGIAGLAVVVVGMVLQAPGTVAEAVEEFDEP